MKYKVGDRVRIKEYINNKSMRPIFVEDMEKYKGRIMTVRAIIEQGIYKMKADDQKGGIWWNWREEWIEGLAEPRLSDTEIFKLAISTYGEDEQIRMCQEEMDELGVAFSKYHRNPCKETEADVQEEIADTKIMLQQMSMIFGEKEIAEIQEQKIERLRTNIDDERPVEIVIGAHKRGGKNYIWQNPKGYHVEVGGAAMAETKYGECPIIIKEITTEKKKYTKQHRCITGGKRA